MYVNYMMNLFNDTIEDAGICKPIAMHRCIYKYYTIVCIRYIDITVIIIVITGMSMHLIHDYIRIQVNKYTTYHSPLNITHLFVNLAMF